MITERELIEGHASFWQIQTPSLSRLVRSLNLAGRELFDTPMHSTSSADRIFLVNEVAFELAAARLKGNKSSISDAISLASVALKKIDNVEESEFDLTGAEREEAITLAKKILFGIPDHLIKGSDFGYRPNLKGMGAIISAEIDMEFGDTLVEIKSGDRKIRSIDIRQVIIYYVLSKSRSSGRYKNCYIINPRQGIRLHFAFDDLVAAVSAKPSVEFCASFADYLIDWKPCA